MSVAPTKRGKQKPKSKYVRKLARVEFVEETGQVVVTSPGVLKLDLLGTAEAAERLGVERPRIGRWLKSKNGAPPVMLSPFAQLKSGPVWLRQQIEAMMPARNERRRPPKGQ